MQGNLQSVQSRAGLLFLFALFLLPLLINPVISLNFNDIFLNVKAVWTLAVIFPSATYLIWCNRHRIDRITTGLLSVWLGWLIVADLLSARGLFLIIGAPNRLQGLPVYCTYALVTLAVFLWSKNNAQTGELLNRTLGWLAVPLGIYVALQYYGIAGIISGNATEGIAATISGATLGNRGYLAGCMALLLPLTATVASQSRWKLLFVFLVGFSLTASLTRGALVAAALGYLLWMVQGNIRHYPIHLALVLGLLAPLPHLTVGQADLRNFGSSDGGQAVTDSSGRAPLWNTAMYGIQLRPLFGWGTGQLLNVMAQRPDAQLLSELKVQLTGRTATRLLRTQDTPLNWRVSGGDKKPEQVTEPTNAVHNEYLEYAFTYGIPAALAFVALFLLGVARAWNRLPWAAAALVAYMTYLLTWPETVRFAPLAWAVLGMALASGPVSRRAKVFK
ncbi:O-antigen ligase family protein (plasmid) [Deinococcus radiomollis]|uniref:O-antigen ligase family protein n=1 Tax=Deinococcus radiomollis TaxID=468916 RepID=UPI0038913DD3